MLLKFLKNILLMVVLSLISFFLCNTFVTKVSATKVVPNNLETNDLLSKLNPDRQLNPDIISSNKITDKQQMQSFTDQNTVVTPAPPGTNDYDTAPDPDYPAGRTATDHLTGDNGPKSISLPAGKIAYVSNAKQFIHALYGNYCSGRNTLADKNRLPYQNSTYDGYYYDTDITKIVLTKDINLANINDDPTISVRDNKGKLQQVNFSRFDFANNIKPTNCGECYYTLANLPSWHTISGNMDTTTLVIDGTYKGIRHSLALGTFNIETWTYDGYARVNHDIQAQNMDIYGSSFYGLIWGASTNNYTIETFDNVNYYGSQLAYNDDKTQTIIKNKTTVYSLANYKVPDDNRTYACEGNKGDQQNFQTNNIVFEPGSVYRGYTYNANVIELTGKAVLKDNSRVNLYPHGNSAENKNILNEGILMKGNNPSLELYGSAKLNIDCNTQNLKDSNSGDISSPSISSISADDNTSDGSSKYNYSCGAFNMYSPNSVINFYPNDNGASPEVNITSESNIYDNDPLVYLGGGKANLSHGKFSVDSKHLGTYNTANSGGLLKFDNLMAINVKSGGDFNVDVGDNDNDANDPINLIYASNLNVSIMNPKNVNLDLRNDKCANSALVYINNNTPQTIKAYDTRISASGNSKIVSGSNIPGSLGKDTNGKDVSFGNDAPLRVQTLDLPFMYSAINSNMYLNNTARIQAPQDTLDELKDAMAEMNGKEFRFVHMSDLPGPVISNIPRRSSPKMRTISGKVTGDKWQNVNDPTSISGKEFDPKPPLINVKVQHHNTSNAETTSTDLGTVGNEKEARQKKNNDPNNNDTVPVSPNRLINDNLDISDANIGKPIDPNSTPPYNKEPQYLDAKDISWSDKNNFSYNLDDLLKKYNTYHPDDKLSLKPTDTIKTSAVTNYQETPIQNTRITNIDLQAGDEPSKPFLLGETINMPFKYLDTDSEAKILSIKGNVYKLVTDDNGNIEKQLIKPFEETINIKNHLTEWTNAQLQLPVESTKNPGNYIVEFNGSDDNGNVYSIDNEDSISWKYTVSGFPKYNGEKVINDHRNNSGDEKYPNIVGNLQYTLKTIFKVANSDVSNPLSNVEFTHPGEIDDIANSDQNITDLHDYTLTASYIDEQGKTQSKQLNDFNYNTSYKPGDFGLGSEFPAGVIFTITHKIKVNNLKPKDRVHIGADQMLSTNDKNETSVLGTSNSIDYNSIGSIVLNVADTMNFGSHTLPFNREKPLFMKDGKEKPIVEIDNNTSVSQPVTLTAQTDGDGSSENLDNWLYFRTWNSDTSTSLDTPMSDKITVYHGNIGTDSQSNKIISNNWFDDKGEQKFGPILKFSTSPRAKTYSTKITWSLTNSL